MLDMVATAWIRRCPAPLAGCKLLGADQGLASQRSGLAATVPTLALQMAAGITIKNNQSISCRYVQRETGAAIATAAALACMQVDSC